VNPVDGTARTGSRVTGVTTEERGASAGHSWSVLPRLSGRQGRAADAAARTVIVVVV